MPHGSAEIIHGDALDLPIDDATVDLIVTSPPYFGLRSYTDGGEHYEGQIGDEETPAEYVDHLLRATREMMRVLKPSGSIWVNLGDKYAGNGIQRPQTVLNAPQVRKIGRATIGVRHKSLVGIPWRYAIRCIDELGLILRAEVLWDKANGLPESVTDRVRRSHETWFHLVKEPHYYSAVDEIREETIWADHHNKYARRGYQNRRAPHDGEAAGNYVNGRDEWNGCNPLGRMPGSVWSIPTQPLHLPPELGTNHFAAFPMEWPRRIIKGWSPREVCTVCRQGRRPLTDVQREPRPTSGPMRGGRNRTLRDGHPGVAENFTRSTIIVGWCCDCPEPDATAVEGVVLDPFGGTGTTALVAKVLGRRGISVDLSHDYVRIAKWRTNDERELAAAAGLPPPPKQAQGQLAMFTDADAEPAMRARETLA